MEHVWYDLKFITVKGIEKFDHREGENNFYKDELHFQFLFQP